MVSRYHWVTLQSSGFLSSGSIQSLMFQQGTIPAHGILKKVLLNNMKINARQFGNTEKGLNTWVQQQAVTINSGPNNGRILWNAYRRIPMAIGPQFSNLSLNYTGWYNAGDDELGVDQKCSYGKSSDTLSWTVQVAVSLVGLSDGSNTSFASGAGEYTVQAKLLYFL